jgi:hypothetical protein
MKDFQAQGEVQPSRETVNFVITKLYSFFLLFLWVVFFLPGSESKPDAPQTQLNPDQTSVAEQGRVPGSRILMLFSLQISDSGSRIRQEQKKRRGKKILSYFFVAINFTKLKLFSF